MNKAVTWCGSSRCAAAHINVIERGYEITCIASGCSIGSVISSIYAPPANCRDG